MKKKPSTVVGTYTLDDNLINVLHMLHASNATGKNSSAHSNCCLSALSSTSSSSFPPGPLESGANGKISEGSSPCMSLKELLV